jgi:hypothetical protein
MFGSIMSGVRSHGALLILVLACLCWPASSAWAQECPDGDLDGYADCTVPGCDPSGLLCGDCDDANIDANPNEVEACNHFDDDCNGLVDEGFSLPLTLRNVSDVANGAPHDQFGRSVAAVGDVNADGLDDFIVGVHLDETARGGDAGSVLLFSGADQSIICRATDPSGQSSDWMGYSVAGVGDVTGDGTPDFAAGEVYDDTSEGTNAGSVVVFSGADCSFVRKMIDLSGAANDYLGWAVAGVDDVDGDNTPDIAAGAYAADPSGSSSGHVIVFSGDDGAEIHRLTDPDGAANDQFGWAVAGIGDVDTDGVGDIAVGVPGDDDLASNAGSVIVFSGASGTRVRRITDGGASDQLGYSVAAIGDVNSDGVDDILAGAPYEDSQNTNAGAAVVLSGADGTRIRLLTDPFGEGNDFLGVSVAVMDDITGDGIQEVVTGAYQDDDVATNAGSVSILNPANGDQVDKLTDPAGVSNDQFGLSVAAVSDLSGDGAPEILVGVHLAQSQEETDVGKVMVFSYEADCDGDGVSPFATDCDDTDSANYSGNTEVCDAQDNDCDGAVDEDDDGDGSDICSDCDPANPLIYPGAPELCNGVDDDCDTFVDNGPDADSDGSEAPCDCDDQNPGINPGEPEVCNYADENCSLVDEGFAHPLALENVSDTADGAPSDYFGQSVVGVGDVNADGLDDFVVGIYLDDNANGFDAGSVLLYSGGDRSIICRAVDPVGTSSDWLGYSRAAW